MKDNPVYCIVYMFLLAAVASGILIGVDRATSERVENNQRLQKYRAVLEAFHLADAETPDSDVLKTFNARVTVAPDGAETQKDILEYRLKAEDSDEVIAYAIPIYGKGFWDMISGVLAVEKDRRTVIGISFFEQKETPGLGAEIENPQWRAGFKGKKLAETGKALKIRPVGEELTDSSVHAVTGATQTSVRVERFLNARVEQWRQAVAGQGAGE